MLPESEEEAGRLFRAMAARGRARRGGRGRSGGCARTTSAPTASRARARASSSRSASSPTSGGVVLPHERTHRGPKEGRLRLLRATRAQLEPIFLLYDDRAAVRRSAGAGAGPRRRGQLALADRGRRHRATSFADLQLLIADGHHRYETALAFHDEDGSEESAWMMVVLVVDARSWPDDLPHASRLPGRAAAFAGRLGRRRRGGAASARHRAGCARRGRPGDAGRCDRRRGRRGLARRPARRPARARGHRVHARLAGGRAPRSRGRGGRRVPASARRRSSRSSRRRARGEVMPQKTTYFYPKLLSGLLFHPI